MPGTSIPERIGPYEVRSELGRGGMGMVFLARDTRLDRAVAVKSLPADLAGDADRLARFEREAKVLAALNHTNIAAIYGLEETGGHRFLILEFVEGQTLGDRLAAGPLPVDEAIAVARQMAHALEAAHEKGVVHRDLKPANVMIRADGVVKVLDFGLARAGDNLASGIPSDSPTGTYHAAPQSPTIPGAIMGTAGYMSPEQARGKLVDKRSDIFSFGCVVYESLTGSRPFSGESLADALSAVLHREPDWTELPPQTPVRVRELLKRCLEKDAKNRLRDIGDARIELDRALDTHEPPAVAAPAPIVPVTPRGRSVRNFVLGLGLLAAGSALTLAAWSAFSGLTAGRQSTGPPRVNRLGIEVPRNFSVLSSKISPDGRSIIYGGYQTEEPGATGGRKSAAYLRRLDSFRAVPLDLPTGPDLIAYSPDSAWFAMIVPVSADSRRLRVVRMSSDGGETPVTIADLPEEVTPHSIVWPATNDIYVSQYVPPKIVHIGHDTGRVDPPAAITFPGSNAEFVAMSPLPGTGYLFADAGAFGERGYVQSIHLIDTRTYEVKPLIESGSCPRYSPTGHLLFSRADTLLAVQFDPVSLRVTGSPVAVAEGLRTRFSWMNGEFDLSRDGTLTYIPGGVQGARRQLVVIDETGKAVPFCPDRRAMQGSPCVSPDGQRVAVTVTNAFGVNEIWASLADRSTLQRVISVPRSDCDPIAWTPDNSRIIFSRRGEPASDDGIYIQPAQAGERPTLVTRNQTSEMTPFYGTVVSDRSAVLAAAYYSNRRGNTELLLLPLDGTGVKTQAIRTLVTGVHGRGADISPDGRWLAIGSSDPEQPGVLIRSINPDGTLGSVVPIVAGDVSDVRFRPTPAGAPLELMYVDARNRSYAGTLTTSPAISWKQTKLVADASQIRQVDYWPRLLGDGRLIMTQAGPEEEPANSIHVVLNWFEELKQKLPSHP